LIVFTCKYVDNVFSEDRIYNNVLFFYLHGKNGFAEVSKNLVRYKSEKITLFRQNNYVRRLT